ncbi:cytochrome P450 [Saccharopolyspora gloriosae]|uniref:Cytochrome P450 n=1 Tax=Saccharopolyspora gloriosae TaxID=455344 RepID=A0A840N9M2_9PSEU|nr:cytochrome P450 [Saccharopolyspora gloriosae]
MTDLFTASDPFAALAELRAAGPVHRVRTPDGPEAWLLTRYADVRGLLGDQRLALNREHSNGADYAGFDLPPQLDAHLLNSDPPRHTRLRREIAPSFTAQRVRAMAPEVRAVAGELARSLPADVDLVADFAVVLPVRVIAELLPLPAEARRDFAAWADALLRHSPGSEPRARDTMHDMRRIIGGALGSAPPDGTLLSGLLTARAGERLDSDELTSMVFYLLFVWYEIMVHAVSSAVLRLLGTGASLDQGVEEVLRFHPPQLLAAPRYALAELTVDGVTVPAGDTLLLSLASANRDEHVFDDAEAFSPERSPNPHLSLGHGIHACPASALTRVIAVAAVEALREARPGLSLAVTPETATWRGNFRHRGPATLPSSPG